MPKLGWGVIGAGGIADRRTIPEGILPAKNAKLVAVMSPTPLKVQAIGAKYGVPAYDSTDALLADTAVEAVYIASPNYLHKEHCIAAARAGKHILCEKPLAMNTREADSIISACEKARVKLGVGFMMRFHAYHEHLRKMIDKGQFGTIVFARAQLTCWYPPIEGAWRQDPKLGGGGAIMDLAVHCVDLLETLLGPVSEVSAFIERAVHPYKSDDANALMLKFKSGAIGFVDAGFCIPDQASENVLEIQGTKGSAKARMTVGQGEGGELLICAMKHPGGYSPKQTRDDSTYQPVAVKTRNTYLAQIEAFSDAVLKNTEPPVNAQAGLHSMQVVEAAVKSAATGRVQKLR
jgi:predicted dehydrogenase